jgi:hypothetical protein
MTVRAVMIGVGNAALENSARLIHAEGDRLAPGLDAALLVGSAATKEAVLSAVGSAAGATEQGDVLIVCFSAHASTDSDLEREWISLADTAISDLELSEQIGRVQAGARVVLVADACKILGVGNDNAVLVYHVLVRRRHGGQPVFRRLDEPYTFRMPRGEDELDPPDASGLIRVSLLDLDYVLLELPASTQRGTTSSDATCRLPGSAETVSCSAYSAALVRALRNAESPSYLDAHEQIRQEMGGAIPNARLYTPRNLRNYMGPTFVDTDFFSQPDFDPPTMFAPMLAD